MKKKLNIFFSFLAVCIAVLGLSFSVNTPSLSASAASVQINYNTKGGSIVTSGDTTADENGYVSNYAVAELSGYVFLGWAISEEAETLVDTSTQFSTDTTLYARWSPKSYVYTISQNEDSSLTIESASVSGKTYTLSSTAESLNDAVRLIEIDNVTTTASTLNFNNYTLHENESITLTESATISGSLTSTNDLPIFNIVPATSGCIFTFSNIVLSNIETTKPLIDVSQSTYGVTIKLNEAVFDNNPNVNALNIQSNTTLSLAGEIKVMTNNLFEYKSGLTFLLNDTTLSSVTGIKIAIDYMHDNTPIATEVYAANADLITFVSKNDLYSVYKTLAGKTLIANTSINVDYDTNGGNFATDYIKPTLYYTATDITLPTTDNITKSYSTFDGWFGKLVLTEEEKTSYNLDSTTWYFDTTALTNFLSTEDVTLADIGSYFSTSLISYTIDTSITSYAYNEPATVSNEWANFFLSLNTSPTLIAKWNDIEYTITFETNGGTDVTPITGIFGETITEPSSIKTGYTLLGWYTDSTLTNKFTFASMPAINMTLYASWQINSYTITFVKNNGEENSEITQNFAETISFPTDITLTGYELVGWYTTADLSEEFTGTTVPAENITLYASWNKCIYKIFLDLNGNGIASPIETLYGEIPTAPSNPTATGYTFHGWYTDKTYTTLFDFTQPTPATNRFAYARWVVQQYKLTYVFNNGTTNSTLTKDYKSKIVIPTVPTRTGYSFAGWFSDNTLTNQFDFTQTMPANDLTLYAKWIEKININITFNLQTIETDSHGAYKIPSTLTGFSIEYLVDNTWQSDVPNKVGVYDIRVYRAEDATYAEYYQVIEDAFEVKQKTLDISWLPIALLIVFILEIVMVIIIKLLRKKKLTQTITLTITLPFGLIPKTQFIFTAITGVLALFGFIYMVVELVKLHRTVPQQDEQNTKYDNRATLEKRGDKSEDKSISSNVDNLLKREGLYAKDYSKDDSYKIDDDIIGRADDSYTGKRPVNNNFDDDIEEDDNK